MTWRSVWGRIGRYAQHALEDFVATALHAFSLATYLVVGWLLDLLHTQFSPHAPWNWMFWISKWAFFLMFVYRLIAEVIFRRGGRYRRPPRGGSRP